MKKSIPSFVAGLLCGMTLFGGSIAYAAGMTAEPTWNPIFVDGVQVEMEAYRIGGHNYVKLRDVGKAVGFNVYWDDGVRVERGKAYTGAKPEEAVSANEAAAADNAEVRLAFVQEINAARRKYGVAELEIDQRLMDAAQTCSAGLYTSHNNRVECTTVADCGYPHGFGANLTVFTSTAADSIPVKAVTNWINSPGHLRTLIDPAAESVGVGFTIENGKTFCYMFTGIPATCNPYA